MMFYFDTETALIEPGKLAPPLTCMTYCSYIGERASLLDRKEAVLWFEAVLKGTYVIVGQNVAYDMAVMAAECPRLLPLIFQAYAEDRVTDTMIRQWLIDIGEGKLGGYADSNGKWHKRGYSLQDLYHRHHGILLEKDEWRLRYGEFRDVPIEQWPEGAREYPRKDAEATRDVFLSQERSPDFLLVDQYRQARAYWALHLSSAWGVHTDAEAVRVLAEKTRAAHEEIKQELITLGLVRADGSRDTKAAKKLMVEIVGDKYMRTDSGDVALSEEACRSSDDSRLETYALYSTLAKVESNDLKLLESGVQFPLQPRYGIAETGRTTCSKPNLQNIRRAPDKGKLDFLDVRATFRPRPGYVFAQADYSSFELFCLAQSCKDLLGYDGELGKALNSGLDPHCVVAATILHSTHDEVKRMYKHEASVDAVRQTGKVANFGFPGGLGAKKLVDFAKKGYNVILAEHEAKQLKDDWFRSWPEMRDFFAYVTTLETSDGFVTVCPRSHRVRSRSTFCAAANTMFQGVAADAAKRALWLVSYECYVDKTSPLYRSRLVAFVHDELILESPVDKAPEAAERLSVLMVRAAREFLPGMPGLKAEPCLMAYWSKKAETLRNANGRLMVWAGEK